MQLRTLILTTAIAVAVTFTPTANAAVCTKDQMKEMDKLDDDHAMDKACPDDDSSDSLDFDDDPKKWATASPCKDTACVTYLKSQVAKMPSCEIEKLNVKTVFEDKLTLCIDIASGKLSSAEIKKRVSNLTAILDDWDDSDDSSDSGSDSDDVRKKQKRKVAKFLSTNSSSTANVTAQTPTSTPTPTPTKKSGATAVAITSGAVFVVATLTSLTAA
jgi:hypothetical protein